MTIEPISNNNINPLAQLMLNLWPDTTRDEALEDCKAILASKKETCYLAREGDSPIAFIHVTLRSDYVEGATSTAAVAYIEGLYVNESQRRKGIAKMLIQTAETWARQNGCTQLASDTEITNTTSIHSHKQIGFTEVNRIVCFIKDL